MTGGNIENATAQDADYLARFGGIGRHYGNAAMERLHAAHVCVVGIGGVGSWVVEALARTGIGALTIVDAADGVRERGELAVDVRHAHVVRIHDRQRADACARERLDDPGADAADADDAHMRRAQPLQRGSAVEPPDAAEACDVIRIKRCCTR